MKKLNNEEKVLQVLLDKYQSSNTNQIYVYKSDFSSLNMDEKDIIRTLLLLHKDGLFSVVRKSAQNDLNVAWTIEFNSTGVHYFENQKKASTSNKREWVRTYMPITISLIALIKSFVPEIISVWQWLMQLLK